MKHLLLVVCAFFAYTTSAQEAINVSLDFAGTLTDPDVEVTATEIGDEFYLDVNVYSTYENYTPTYADIWFTFNNEAFEYLGVENPLDENHSWYTYQWCSCYKFNNAPNTSVDDLHGQYFNGHTWEYVGDASSVTAPMVITTQSYSELNGNIARLKFKYKQVPNGYDYTDAIILRKAYVRDNGNGYTFQNVKAYPNQTFSNTPTSTTVTAKLNIDFPETLDPTKFSVLLYVPDTEAVNSWNILPGAEEVSFDTNGDADITPGFTLTDSIAAIINYTGDFQELYDNIVTISDVSLAFKELSNRGINQDEVGNELGYAIQLMNADVDQSGSFDSDDTYKLLGHVIDTTYTYINEYYPVNAMKLFNKAAYDNITEVSSANGTTLMLDLDQKENELNQSFEGSITWRGDVNLSHSSTPVIKSETTAATIQAYRSYKTDKTVSTWIQTELVDGEVKVLLELDPNGKSISGTQYKVKYDSQKLTFSSILFDTTNSALNFGTPNGDYVKFGTLIQDGDDLIQNKVSYILTFKPKVSLDNALGLVVITNTDAVDNNGDQLKINMQ